MIINLEKSLSHHIRALFVLIFVGLITNSCVNLKPQSDPTRYFVLAGAFDNIEESGHLQIAIERIELPSYLQSQKIAIKISAHEIIYAEHYRWAEELETSVAKIIRNRLRVNNHIKSVSVYPWKDSVEYDYRIRLIIHHFEGDYQGNITLAADWKVVNKAGNVLTNNTEQLTGFWDGSDYNQMVEGMNELLLQLCSKISEVLNDNVK